MVEAFLEALDQISEPRPKEVPAPRSIDSVLVCLEENPAKKLEMQNQVDIANRLHSEWKEEDAQWRTNLAKARSLLNSVSIQLVIEEIDDWEIKLDSLRQALNEYPSRRRRNVFRSFAKSIRLAVGRKHGTTIKVFGNDMEYHYALTHNNPLYVEYAMAANKELRNYQLDSNYKRKTRNQIAREITGRTGNDAIGFRKAVDEHEKRKRKKHSPAVRD